MESGTLKLGGMIKQALEEKNLRTFKQAAQLIGISSELLRIVVSRGHVPKDAILGKIADKLGLDKAALILAAHREKAPLEVQGCFLSLSGRKAWQTKRVWPLSEEQCDYLRKIMNEDEIQIIRKLRQVPGEARTQIVGYVDYTWASKRTTMDESDSEEKSSEGASSDAVPIRLRHAR